MQTEMDNSEHDAFEAILGHLVSNSARPETGQVARPEDVQKGLAENNDPATIGLTWRMSMVLAKKIKSSNSKIDARLNALEASDSDNPLPHVTSSNIEARLNVLEQRRTMSFECAHDPSRTYQNGDVVQRSNALYVCMMDTTDTPGDSASWRRIGVSK